MTGRVSAAQVRTPSSVQQPKTPAKPQTAAQTAQTAAAGWGAGAKVATSLKITRAAIDDGPKMGKIQAPKGFSVAVKDLSNKASDTVHGQKVTIEQSDQQVTISGPGGKKVTIGGSGGIDQTLADWKAEVKATKSEPKSDYPPQLSWDNQNSISGAGTAGRMISLASAGSSYTGGAHPNNYTVVNTYDAATGKQVKLDSLLTQQQMSNLVKDIGAKLGKLDNGDGIEGSSFSLGDAASLRETINNNFALTTDKNGKVQIEIAWESGIHALGGQMAHFTVDAPTDPAFKAKIGLETTAAPVAR